MLSKSREHSIVHPTSSERLAGTDASIRAVMSVNKQKRSKANHDIRKNWSIQKDPHTRNYFGYVVICSSMSSDVFIKWKAALIMLSSVFMYSLQNLNVKYAGQTAGFWTLTFVRSTIGFILALPSLYFYRQSVVSNNVKLLVFRGLLGGTTVCAGYFAVLHCSLLQATMVFSTAPLFTAAIKSRYGGYWTIYDTVAALLCIAGVIVVTFEQTTGIHVVHNMMYMGLSAALLSALSQAGVNTLITMAEDPPTTLALAGCLGCMVISGPGFIYEQIASPIPLKTLPSYISVGALSFSAQVLKSMALQLSRDDIRILLIRHIEVIFSLIWDIIVFHISIAPYSIYGCLLVVVSCIGVFLMKHNQPQTQTQKEDVANIV